MKFLYSSIVAQSNAGDFFLIRRPEIPVTVSNGPDQISLVALVDTGSDHTIFPRRIARLLNIALTADEAPSASAYGGSKLDFVQGEITVHVEDENEQADFKVPVCFFEFDDPEQEIAILGFSGFLEYFTATFEGDQAILTLVPNVDSELVAI